MKKIILRVYKQDTVTATDEKGVVVSKTIEKLWRESPPLCADPGSEEAGEFIRRNPEYAQSGTILKSLEVV